MSFEDWSKYPGYEPLELPDAMPVLDWLRAEMSDMIDWEVTHEVDGPYIFGDGRFEVRRDEKTNRWKAFPKE